MNFHVLGVPDDVIARATLRGRDPRELHAVRRGYARIGRVPRRRFAASCWTLLCIEHRIRAESAP